jgi:hypothetical protein
MDENNVSSRFSIGVESEGDKVLIEAQALQRAYVYRLEKFSESTEDIYGSWLRS